MIHHYAAWTGEAWAVAYHSATLGAVAVADGFPTQQAATSEADRLNFESAARTAHAVRTKPHHYGQRRSVRYFEPDAFA